MDRKRKWMIDMLILMRDELAHHAMWKGRVRGPIPTKGAFQVFVNMKRKVPFECLAVGRDRKRMAALDRAIEELS